MAVSPTKKPASKTVKKEAAPAKKSATKKPAIKKTAAKKPATPKARKISAEERYKMVEIAAYYIAEHNNFKGNAIDFWVAAEEEISKNLG